MAGTCLDGSLGLGVTNVGQLITAMRALAADLVIERERVRSLERENRELMERFEALCEATVCPHCGVPLCECQSPAEAVGVRPSSS